MNFGFNKSCQASKKNFFFLQKKKITISKKQILFKKNTTSKKYFLEGKNITDKFILLHSMYLPHITEEKLPNKTKTHIMQ
jgi:hypothetical protein